MTGIDDEELEVSSRQSLRGKRDDNQERISNQSEEGLMNKRFSV